MLLWPVNRAIRRLFRVWSKVAVHALEGVSLSADARSSVGVIGHNGLGETMLLKLMARVTEPTEGTGRRREPEHQRPPRLLRVGPRQWLGTGAMPDPVDAGTLARRVAGFGLPGVDGPAWSVTDEDWRPFLSHLIGERITGLAVAGAEAGWLHLTPAQSAELLTRHREAMLWVLTLERGLVRRGAEFGAAGIDFVVLKGPAVARGFYPDPSWRAFADIDLLVRTADWRRACTLLAELGFRRDLPEPRSGFDERFGKAAAHTGTDGSSLDLHRTLVLGPFGLWIEPDVLFERTTAFTLGGVSFKRFDPTIAFLHACVHASLGWRPPLLTPVRDVAQLATGADVKWEEVEEFGGRWRLGVVVRHALGTARDTLGVTLPWEAERLMLMKPSRRERKTLEAYVSERRTRGGMALATLRALPRPREKVAYVRGLLFPARDFLAARVGGTGPTSYLRRWAVPARWMRGRPSHRK